MTQELAQAESMIGTVAGLLSEMQELGQPRTDFVLKHFVVGTHDRPARQRKQILDELQAMMFSLADMVDSVRLAELDIQEMEAQEPANDFVAKRQQISIGQKRRQIQAVSLQVNGRLAECRTLLAILAKMPKYTREEMEAEEAEYWTARLSRQFLIGQKDVGGNLTAIVDMLTEPGTDKPAIPDRLENIIAYIGVEAPALPKGEK